VQAVGAAYGKAEPPADLRIMWYCQRWGALPEAGGIYDQSDTQMHRMSVLDNVHRAVYKKQSIINPHDIHNLTESDRRILKWLIDEGIITF